MTSISYDEIYARFMTSVTAYDVASMVEYNARTLISGWMHSVRAIPKVRKIFASIELNDETQTLKYELKQQFDVNDEATNNDYVSDVFGLGVAWRWASQKYKSVLITNQVYGGKEEKFYSQANHATALNEMQKECKNDLYSLISQHVVVNNSYLSSQES